MMDWRTMRVMFLLPLFLLGLISVVLLQGISFDDIHVSFLNPSSSITPRVSGAVSIAPVIVNPVVHIDMPDASVFAPDSSVTPSHPTGGCSGPGDCICQSLPVGAVDDGSHKPHFLVTCYLAM